MPEKPLSDEKITGILKTLHIELKHLLGEQLIAVYLYGSQARGDARPDSDIDVLIILRDDFDYGEMINRTGQLAADLSLENDTVLSLAFVSAEDYHYRNTPFLMNVRREGIVI